MLRTSTAFRAALVALLVPVLLLAGCGFSPRSYLGSNFTSRGGDSYFSNGPVGRTVDQIVGARNPDARAADGATQYLRYGNDVVAVQSAGNGSEIRIGDYRSGQYNHLGPGFNSSPAEDDGGPGEGK